MEGFTYNNKDPERGIIQRTIEDIFYFIESTSNENTKFIIRASYLQIYNENISDLLKPEKKNLQIREDKKKGIYVKLTDITAENFTVNNKFSLQKTLCFYRDNICGKIKIRKR